MAKGEKAAAALIVGAALGFAAGVLTAPKSGKETREDIKVAAVKLKKDAAIKLAMAKTELGKAIDEATARAKDLSGKSRKELDDLIVKGKAAQAKSLDVLSAVKNGESDDKDLKKALNDAKSAKNNLWSYLGRK